MLYTAQAYVNKIIDRHQHAAARQQLAPLIRCPQLSLYWLSASVYSPDAPNLLLSPSDGFRAELQKLLIMRQANPNGVCADAVRKALPDAPVSWHSNCRAHKQLSSPVRMQWAVEVAALKAAAQSSAQSGRLVELQSYPANQLSAPLGGVRFSIEIQCQCQKPGDAPASTIGVFVMPYNLPAGTYYNVSYTLQCDPHVSQRLGGSQVIKWGSGMGWPNLFGLDAMPNGWDDAAWSAKGLPLTGQLVFTVNITSVNGCKCGA